MQPRQPRLKARPLLAAVTALALAAPAWAGTWTFQNDSPLLSGGTVFGTFSGTDFDADAMVSGSELSGFSVSYLGVPPATASFSIVKSALDAGDLFSFDLGAGDLRFSVTDGQGRSISGGSFEFTSVVGSDFVDAGGSLVVTAVPEPSTFALMAAGVAAIGLVRRRRSDNGRYCG